MTHHRLTLPQRNIHPGGKGFTPMKKVGEEEALRYHYIPGKGWQKILESEYKRLIKAEEKKRRKQEKAEDYPDSTGFLN